MVVTRTRPPAPVRTREERAALLAPLLTERILVLDGAMGSLIQTYELDEAGFRGEHPALRDHPRDVRGDNDLLSLTQPDIVRAIHDAYLDAGADIIETNTFNANGLNQAEYGLEGLAREMNVSAARLARAAADAAEEREPDRPRFVAGALGPTNKTLSISPDVNDPGARGVTFEGLAAAYREAAEGLIEGGVDILLVETIFDTLNAKAAVYAIEEAFDELGVRLPLMISGTIVDASGRTLSGQTVEAFWNSMTHARPVIVGLNCALGARQLRDFIAELSRIAPLPVSAYPNGSISPRSEWKRRGACSPGACSSSTRASAASSATRRSRKAWPRASPTAEWLAENVTPLASLPQAQSVPSAFDAATLFEQPASVRLHASKNSKC